MKKLLTHKNYRNPIILNLAGIFFALTGWFLNEFYLAGKLMVGGSYLLLTGIILWGMGEATLVRSLLQELEKER